MTLAQDFAKRRRQGPANLAPLRWGSALATVLVIHIVVVWLATGWRALDARPNQQQPAVLIDLPPAPPKEDKPSAPTHQAKPEPAVDRSEKPAEEEKSGAPKAVSEKPTQLAPPAPAPVIKLPEAPKMDWAKEPLAVPSQTQATGRAASSVSAASWQRALVAHINRFQRQPPGAGASGTPTVVFVVSPSGQVLAAKLASPSGDPAFDREAVAMIYRASPVPRPPGVSDNVTVSLAIHFGR